MTVKPLRTPEIENHGLNNYDKRTITIYTTFNKLQLQLSEQATFTN